jgi:hypothetical protein
MAMSSSQPTDSGLSRHTLRTVLVVFLLTFLASRVTVFLIMSHRVPDLYMHAGGTHVHHLNYGIFLLSGVGLYLLARRPSGAALNTAAIVYAIGLDLTFDEFGMWFHLGGSYWQRASFDMVIVIAATIGTMVYAPALKRFKPHNWVTAIVMVAALTTFTVLFVESFDWADRKLDPEFNRLEQESPR